MDESGSRDSAGDAASESDSAARRRVLLDETRLRIVQQILAYEDQALSVAELDWRNTDLDEQAIEAHLRRLAAHDIVEPLTTDESRADLPSTYWRVTACGLDLLERVGFDAEIAVLAEADRALTRPPRIRDIESFENRPVADY
jgi:DNA-binding transcriptional ArsR family regulator